MVAAVQTRKVDAGGFRGEGKFQFFSPRGEPGFRRGPSPAGRARADPSGGLIAGVKT